MGEPSEGGPISLRRGRRWIGERGISLEIQHTYVYIRFEAFLFPNGVASEQETVGPVGLEVMSRRRRTADARVA